MAAKSLTDRVAALEAEVRDKTLQEQFREQAELIDRRFTEQDESIGGRLSAAFRQQAELIDRRFSSSFPEQAELIDQLFVYRFEESDKKWEMKLDARFAAFEDKPARLEIKFEETLAPIRNDLATLKDLVNEILARLP